MSPHIGGKTETDGCITMPAGSFGNSFQPLGSKTVHQQVDTTEQGSNGIPFGSIGARPKVKKNRRKNKKKQKEHKNQCENESGCQGDHKEIKSDPVHKGRHYAIPTGSSIDFSFSNSNDKYCSKCHKKENVEHQRQEEQASSSIGFAQIDRISYPIQASSPQPVNFQPHKYPKFEDFATRKLSYVVFVFPVEQLVEKLIEAGFIYAGHGDSVTCYSCGITQNGWSATDDPWTRHNQMNPDCRHISPTTPTTEETPDIDKIKRENETLRNDKLCKVCLSEDVSVVFLPCGHLVCCLECGNGVNACPICRAQIKASVRVHRPMGD